MFISYGELVHALRADPHYRDEAVAVKTAVGLLPQQPYQVRTFRKRFYFLDPSVYVDHLPPDTPAFTYWPAGFQKIDEGLDAHGLLAFAVLAGGCLARFNGIIVRLVDDGAVNNIREGMRDYFVLRREFFVEPANVKKFFTDRGLRVPTFPIINKVGPPAAPEPAAQPSATKSTGEAREKDLDPRERNNLLHVARALAVTKETIRLDERGAAAELMRLVDLAGGKISHKTARKVVKQMQDIED